MTDQRGSRSSLPFRLHQTTAPRRLELLEDVLSASRPATLAALLVAVTASVLVSCTSPGSSVAPPTRPPGSATEQPVIGRSAVIAEVARYDRVRTAAARRQDVRLLPHVEGGARLAMSLAWNEQQDARARLRLDRERLHPWQSTRVQPYVPPGGAGPAWFAVRHSLASEPDTDGIGIWTRNSPSAPWRRSFTAGVYSGYGVMPPLEPGPVGAQDLALDPADVPQVLADAMRWPRPSGALSTSRALQEWISGVREDDASSFARARSSARPVSSFVLRGRDGSAVVAVDLQVQEWLTSERGRSFYFPEDTRWGPLFGAGEEYGYTRAVLTSQMQALVLVPRRGSGAPVVLGASEQPMYGSSTLSRS